MKILGIESSCDETAASVVEDGRKILSSVVATQLERHKIFGGVVPEIASRMHIEAVSAVVREAMEKANLEYTDLDAVAVTYAPGLIGALLVGVNFAKGLSLSTSLPLVPVHHLRGHIASNYLTYGNLEPPFMCLVVSGGHSHIVEVKSYTDFNIIGRTRDDAAGECLDKAARAMGIPYPGGVNLDKIAQNGNDKAYVLPHPKVDGSEYDFSFSGLKTAAVNIIHNASQKGETIVREDLCASYLKAVTDCLCKNTEKAMNDFSYKRLALAGGVSANSLLRKRMTDLAKKNGWELFLPELSLCGDNAAMIASQGYYEFIAGNTADCSLNAYATMPIDNSYCTKKS